MAWGVCCTYDTECKATQRIAGLASHALEALRGWALFVVESKAFTFAKHRKQDARLSLSTCGFFPSTFQILLLGTKPAGDTRASKVEQESQHRLALEVISRLINMHVQKEENTDYFTARNYRKIFPH